MIEVEALTIKAAIHTGREIKLKKDSSVYRAALMVSEDAFPPDFIAECKLVSAQREGDIWNITYGNKKLSGKIEKSFWLMDEQKNLSILHITDEDAKNFSVLARDGRSLGKITSIF